MKIHQKASIFPNLEAPYVIYYKFEAKIVYKILPLKPVAVLSNSDNRIFAR